MPKLSVCLIVRNEERHLARCLASVRALADEIVVVDTGSTDGTIAIADAHGARVCHFTWCDDFSLAKNYSIEQANGDWVLSIDADETIAARDHAHIRAVMNRSDVNAVVVPQRHYLASDTTIVGWQPGEGGYEEGQPYPGFVDVDCRRLFRNESWLRFRNPVHEELVSLDPAHPLAEVRGNWVVHHFGKVSGRDILRAKGEAYLRIGRKKVDDHPRDPQAHFELGVQYAELQQYELARPCFERALALAPGFRDAQFRLGLCHYELKDYRKALTSFRGTARAVPRLAADIALAEGNAHRELGDPEAAEKAFRRAIAVTPGFAPAFVNLALLLIGRGRAADALTCVTEALTYVPAHTELRVLRGRLRADAGDDAGALDDFACAEGDLRATRWRARILARQRRFAEAAACLGTIDALDDADLSALRGAVALGLGRVDEAAAHLRYSAAEQPTAEAALNLSAALHAGGDDEGALAAAADALRLAPAEQAALARFAQLAGDRFRRTTRGADEPLTLFFYQPCSVPFTGDTPRARGLGGTESAIVYLAEALARRGHRCVVLNSCDEPATLHGVEYARWETMPQRCVAEAPDVLVAVRFWETIGRARFAPVQIFWTGDAFDQPFLEQFGDAPSRAEIDLVMLQSDWHVDTFRQHHRVPLSRVARTRLGAAATAAVPPIVASAGARLPRLAYASTPFRGLDVLLEVFPRIRAACPDAELEVFSSMRVYGVNEAEDRKQFDAVYRKARQPGVTLVGSLPQMELAVRLQQARVLAYPNHYAETFCIAAAEAQAAGCAVVTSARGALPETVGDAGICIPGDPRTAEYQTAFVDACVSLLTDDGRWQGMSERARARGASHFSWPAIAEEWEATCRAALTTEPQEMERIPVHLTSGRAGLAQRMLARTTRPCDIPPDVWSALQALVAAHAGGGTMPDPATLQRIALYFRSLRNAGVIDHALEANVNRRAVA